MDYDKDKKIYPEDSHKNPPEYFEKNRIRIHVYKDIVYIYNISSQDPTKHYCEILYPDNSKCCIYDKLTMQKHIEYYNNLSN